MTTKHVVADDILAQLARRQWELQRRIMEGTLDPQLALASLQQIIEGRKSMLPIETWPMTISEVVYTVTVETGDLYKLAQRSHRLTKIDTDLQRFNPSPRDRRNKTAHVSLLTMDKVGITKGGAITVLRNHGYDPADAWEMIAFAKTAPFMSIVGRTCRILCLGTPGSYYLGDSIQKDTGYLQIDSRTPYSGNPAGWELNIRPDDRSYYHFAVKEGDHVLVRVKK